jgi:hypothetical protein
MSTIGYPYNAPWSGIYSPDAPINAVLGVQEIDTVYPYTVTEPVTVEEAKAYCKIDFNDEDELIAAFITTARQDLERFTGCSFIPKRLVVQVNNGCGGIEIPFGPVMGEVDVSLITDAAGDLIENVFITPITPGANMNGYFPYLEAPCLPYVQLIYDAGFNPLPTQLITAIKAQVFFLYENRGEDSSNKRTGDAYVGYAAQNLAKYYKRVSNMQM